MSRVEAELDGIKIEYDPNYPCGGRRGAYVYSIPCERCGRILKRARYTRTLNYTCDYCKATIRKKKKISKEILEIRTPKEIQFDKAVDRIKKQTKTFDNYKKSIEIARKRTELYGSIPETMVAIELIRSGYSIIPQQRIGKYRVDFAIPKEKVIIEVDGSIYHRVDEKSTLREYIIQKSVGFDWKIIHIPAEKIEKDIHKLGKIIKEMMKI